MVYFGIGFFPPRVFVQVGHRQANDSARLSLSAPFLPLSSPSTKACPIKRSVLRRPRRSPGSCVICRPGDRLFQAFFFPYPGFFLSPAFLSCSAKFQWSNERDLTLSFPTPLFCDYFFPLESPEFALVRSHLPPPVPMCGVEKLLRLSVFFLHCLPVPPSCPPVHDVSRLGRPCHASLSNCRYSIEIWS